MSLNEILQQELERAFKPLGIVAFTNCCRLGCTGTYEEEDVNFEIRQGGGIFFIRLHLNGMNYRLNPDNVYASYEDFDYTMKNWDKEVALLRRWCQIVGVKDFKITKPKSSKEAISISFDKPLHLETKTIDDEDE